MVQRRRIALLIETSNAYARGILRGVARYVRERGSWALYMSEGRRGDCPPWLADWDGDGIIARIENPAVAEVVRATGLPTIDVSAARLCPEFPWVETDDAAITALAAEHLLEKGFQSFGFCNEDRYHWSQWRRDGFRDALGHAGYTVDVFDIPPGSTISTPRTARRLEAWLAGLEKPAGILVPYDFLGRALLAACRRIDIAVPESLAVVSVDDDEVLCELADPPLTSVVLDGVRTGYRAASLLDTLMSGERVDPLEHRIPPLGLVARQSTDVSAIDDDEVARALNYIRKHATSGIRVSHVLGAVTISRRALETRFQLAIGRSPHAEIVRVRMQHVRELLGSTDLTLAAIAERTGFRHVEYLTVAFRRETGETPSAFRARTRALGGGGRAHP